MPVFQAEVLGVGSLRVGIVGLPNAGKTTLFNALSRAGANVAPYPFTTVDPNIGVAPFQDPRLERVADLAACPRRTPATVNFVDIAGLVKGASRGEGLGNQFLAEIREVDAVVHVVRVFEAPDVSHSCGTIDPLRDAELIETELRLADLEVLARSLAKARQAAKSGARDKVERVKRLEELESLIGGEGPLSPLTCPGALQAAITETGLISLKPTMIVLNVGENQRGEAVGGISRWAAERGYPLLAVNAEIEAELAELDPGEAEEYAREMGVEEGSLSRIVRASYQLLGLITFFSIDSGECKAWPVPSGSRAAYAAGRIHTDFEKGFVKAEVVHYEDFVSCGSFSAAREAGSLRIEGRDYVVQDGDVIHFKFAT